MKNSMTIDEMVFPSPTGESHFLICKAHIAKVEESFPSPTGESHFLMGNKANADLKEARKFPSPTGESHFLIVQARFGRIK